MQLDFYADNNLVRQKTYYVTAFSQKTENEIAVMSESEYMELMNRFKVYVENQEPGVIVDLKGIIKENATECPIGQ